jgi:hypothetical protein
MNIIFFLFIIAMLNPLLFKAVDFLQYGNIKHKLTPKHDFPDEWETYTYTDIRQYFNCRERSRDNDKPLPTLGDWKLLRQTYTLIVDNTKKWNDPVPPTEGYSFQKDNKALYHHRIMPNNPKERDVDYSPHVISRRVN